ncbi:membrane protein [Robbsia andropogonis]|uniref:Peptidoglycan-associated lipoprotein n=1 Tax=Robbsia andropogonis TaxID=28092 RepID=A0A0F5K2X1_9BURK|nr:OmpA family protein [Robbsia andropogonis]KKB63892.1 membrane protein [Robbsia andropogonis]MCP1116697.1 OmpA family protein [Robbsia andropogonis]MCP1126624.1 OmpA family protein [Robbsia andropogonis]
MVRQLRGAAIVGLVGLLAACHSGVKMDKDANASGSGYGTQPNPNAVQQVNVDPLNDPNSPLAKRSVYFDFDSYTVSDQYQQVLQAHADYLKSHPERHVLIQGNTDPRGTEEYNLALGQKRAAAVARVLETLGVSQSQIESVSLGKTKASGDGEDAYAQDRRADLIYQ